MNAAAPLKYIKSGLSTSMTILFKRGMINKFLILKIIKEKTKASMCVSI